MKMQHNKRHWLLLCLWCIVALPLTVFVLRWHFDNATLSHRLALHYESQHFQHKPLQSAQDYHALDSDSNTATIGVDGVKLTNNSAKRDSNNLEKVMSLSNLSIDTRFYSTLFLHFSEKESNYQTFDLKLFYRGIKEPVHHAIIYTDALISRVALDKQVPKGAILTGFELSPANATLDYQLDEVHFQPNYLDIENFTYLLISDFHTISKTNAPENHTAILLTAKQVLLIYAIVACLLIVGYWLFKGQFVFSVTLHGVWLVFILLWLSLDAQYLSKAGIRHEVHQGTSGKLSATWQTLIAEINRAESLPLFTQFKQFQWRENEQPNIKETKTKEQKQVAPEAQIKTETQTKASIETTTPEIPVAETIAQSNATDNTESATQTIALDAPNNKDGNANDNRSDDVELDSETPEVRSDSDKNDMNTVDIVESITINSDEAEDDGENNDNNNDNTNNTEEAIDLPADDGDFVIEFESLGGLSLAIDSADIGNDVDADNDTNADTTTIDNITSEVEAETPTNDNKKPVKEPVDAKTQGETP